MGSGEGGGLDLDSTVDVRAAPEPRLVPPATGDPQGRAVAGRYRLQQPLGQGGHGVVWAAEDSLVGRTVAVKLLAAGAGVEPARVRREVSALRMLRVPGVVHLLDEGIDRGQPFLVMELVDGAPFPGSRGALPWAEICDLALALLETVGRIHAAGVLHRDLKPGNVLVSPDRCVTVLDFGLSYGAALGAGLTASSAILGTPAYLAPEHLLGEPITVRTDLHAVGLMLYQALSGKLPHDAEHVGELLRGRATRAPEPLAEVAAGVPRPVAEVVDRLLAVAAADRPQSAEEVLADLKRIAPGAGADAGTGADADADADAGADAGTGAGAAADAGAGADADTRAAGGPDASTIARARDGAPASRRRSAGISPAPAADPASTIARDGAAAGKWLDEVAMRSLFSGPERIFHLPTDGARVLWAHTRGDPKLVADEVRAWVRAGFARWDGQRLAVDRETLDRLEIGLGLSPALPERPAGPQMWRWEDRRHAHRAAASALPAGSAPRLWHLMIADGGGSVGARTEVAREARVLARQLTRAGRLGQAVAALGEALLAVRRRPLPRGAKDDTAVGSILATWVEVAMMESSPRALDRVLYELCRAEPRTPALIQLEHLVRAALALAAGGERALALAEAVPSFSDRALERRRQSLRVLAARRCPLETEEVVLDDVGRWARRTGDPETLAALAGWTGRLRYRQGRFDEAAALHVQAGRAERCGTARVNAQLNAASALLEAFLFGEATARAKEARAIAAECRHPYFEARAEWILRSTAYRSGAALEPDLELCDLVTRVGVADLEALVCLNEAAVAWRAERRSRAVALAARAQRLWKNNGWRAGALLARCLAIGAGDAPRGDESALLALEARSCAVPGIGLQALGLLARAAPGTLVVDPAEVAALAGCVAAAHRDQRMDVLSVAEATEALGATSAMPS